jgi:DNA-binding HxlR family transcriptional regulator
MISYTLSSDRLAILAIIKEAGCSICTGTCEHRKIGELHCHHISQRIRISSNGVKNRLREMVQMGLLERNRVERFDGKVMARYTVSSKGLELLEEIW